MITEHEIKYDESKELYEDLKDYIVNKMCYNNVFNVLSFHDDSWKFQEEQWKIAYGYMSSIEGIMVRHCFIIDSDGGVIDPTVFTTTLSEQRERPDDWMR